MMNNRTDLEKYRDKVSLKRDNLQRDHIIAIAVYNAKQDVYEEFGDVLQSLVDKEREEK